MILSSINVKLPLEALDKILGNTTEEMDRMLSLGYTFDLSDGADRTVTYISFPKGTDPNDVAPVVHGYWIKVAEHVYRCSLCNNHRHYKSRYCPNCGAVMDGKEKNNGTD